MLAGRKLLLADDSLTIQKVVALTFADEGVEVITAGDGQEALEKLKEVTPDIVLADVLMPGVNGYEVCEYIKQNAKLKHIPVMLLVGSFEPFDEAEARRVGADDILTKPFQSIRRLIDKVGGLVGSKPVTDEGPTAELPHVEEQPAEPEKLSTEELEITTADTRPLPISEQWDDPAYKVAVAAQFPQGRSIEKPRDIQAMDSSSNKSINEASADSGELLLDLGDVGQSSDTYADDFVLDIDLDPDESQPAPAFQAASFSGTSPFVEPQLSKSGVAGWDPKSEAASSKPGKAGAAQEPARRVSESKSPEAKRSDVKKTKLERVVDETGGDERAATSGGRMGADQLSPEAIDAIARRVVEHLSEKVVQEIAWEVVPQLAELLIKRKLEEESQPK